MPDPAGFLSCTATLHLDRFLVRQNLRNGAAGGGAAAPARSIPRCTGTAAPGGPRNFPTFHVFFTACAQAAGASAVLAGMHEPRPRHREAGLYKAFELSDIGNPLKAAVQVLQHEDAGSVCPQGFPSPSLRYTVVRGLYHTRLIDDEGVKPRAGLQ